MNDFEIYRLIRDQIYKSEIVSISGESGAGKTLLSQFIISRLLLENKNLKQTCVWIQASETFPLNRLNVMYKDNQEYVNFLAKSFFFIPVRKCGSYSLQKTILKKMSNSKTILPINLKFIVIDNISHHLRYSLSNVSEFSKKKLLKNDFFNAQLFPLIMLCKRNKIVLMLIHENSFNVKSQQSVPFLNNLYSRLNSLKIQLKKCPNSNKKTITIEKENSQYKFLFTILDKELIFFEFKS